MTIMNAVELFPTLRNLTRADKLKVMQFLVSELSRDEEPSLEQGATYPIWSPLRFPRSCTSTCSEWLYFRLFKSKGYL